MKELDNREYMLRERISGVKKKKRSLRHETWRLPGNRQIMHDGSRISELMIVATPSGRRTEKESVTVCLKTSCEKKVNMDVLRASLNVCDSLMTFSSFTCVFYSHFLGIPSYNNTYKYTQKVKTLTRFQSDARVTFLWYSNTCGDAWRKCLYATAPTKK